MTNFEDKVKHILGKDFSVKTVFDSSSFAGAEPNLHMLSSHKSGLKFELFLGETSSFSLSMKDNGLPLSYFFLYSFPAKKYIKEKNEQLFLEKLLEVMIKTDFTSYSAKVLAEIKAFEKTSSVLKMIPRSEAVEIKNDDHHQQIKINAKKIDHKKLLAIYKILKNK